MRLFKFLLYLLALDIGCTIAFCAQDRYDSAPNYELATGDRDQTHRITDTQARSSAKQKDWSEQARIGKKIFKVNCAACHNKNMIDDMTGPALAGIRTRWKDREGLLYEWIKNSKAVIASGDPYAVELYRKWAPAEMNAFLNLNGEEIEAVLVYIDQVAP